MMTRGEGYREWCEERGEIVGREVMIREGE